MDVIKSQGQKQTIQHAFEELTHIEVPEQTPASVMVKWDDESGKLTLDHEGIARFHASFEGEQLRLAKEAIRAGNHKKYTHDTDSWLIMDTRSGIVQRIQGVAADFGKDESSGLKKIKLRSRSELIKPARDALMSFCEPSYKFKTKRPPRIIKNIYNWLEEDSAGNTVSLNHLKSLTDKLTDCLEVGRNTEDDVHTGSTVTNVERFHNNYIASFVYV